MSGLGRSQPLHIFGNARDIHFPTSHPRCLMPLREWKAKGAAKMTFAEYLAASGSPEMASSTWAESKVPGAARYAKK